VVVASKGATRGISSWWIPSKSYSVRCSVPVERALYDLGMLARGKTQP
jgi:hypothetical protein